MYMIIEFGRLGCKHVTYLGDMYVLQVVGRMHQHLPVQVMHNDYMTFWLKHVILGLGIIVISAQSAEVAHCNKICKSCSNKTKASQIWTWGAYVSFSELAQILIKKSARCLSTFTIFRFHRPVAHSVTSFNLYKP